MLDADRSVLAGVVEGAAVGVLLTTVVTAGAGMAVPTVVAEPGLHITLGVAPATVTVLLTLLAVTALVGQRRPRLTAHPRGRRSVRGPEVGQSGGPFFWHPSFCRLCVFYITVVGEEVGGCFHNKGEQDHQ